MPIHQVTLDPPAHAACRDEIARRIFFVSEDIVAFDLPVVDGRIPAIDVHVRSHGPIAQIVAGLRSVAEEVNGLDLLPHTVIWRSTATPTVGDDVFGRLVSCGDVVEVGDGQVAFGQRMMALLDHLDAELRSIAMERFGAVEYRYPTLIPTTTLERAGCFLSFPQALMLVTRLHADSESYQSFERAYGDGDRIDSEVLGYCKNVDLCLPPTMCYHTYAQHRGVRLPPGRPLVITSVGKSFRFESRYARTIERLWDFTIREIVFIGEREAVQDARIEMMNAAFALVSELDLPGQCELANDPFFCSADAASKAFSQRLMELKYELRLGVGYSREVAVASFNYHLDHFATAFDIAHTDGAPMHTACVGFGLERLALAIVAQHGIDEDGWPPALREGVRRRRGAGGLGTPPPGQ